MIVLWDPWQKILYTQVETSFVTFANSWGIIPSYHLGTKYALMSADLSAISLSDTLELVEVTTSGVLIDIMYCHPRRALYHPSCGYLFLKGFFPGTLSKNDLTATWTSVFRLANLFSAFFTTHLTKTSSSLPVSMEGGLRFIFVLPNCCSSNIGGLSEWYPIYNCFVDAARYIFWNSDINFGHFAKLKKYENAVIGPSRLQSCHYHRHNKKKSSRILQ